MESLVIHSKDSINKLLIAEQDLNNGDDTNWVEFLQKHKQDKSYQSLIVIVDYPSLIK